MEITKEDDNVWYAVKTTFCKEIALKEFFTLKGVSCFIPMRMVEVIKDDKTRKEYRPAIHNLLFVKKTLDKKRIINFQQTSPIPFWFVKHNNNSEIYEISSKEMMEMRAVCDPNYTGTIYTDVQTAQARPGQPVKVIRGPFKGLTGKLTQYKRSYYVVITVASMGVMVHIPKWYCEKIDK